MARQVVLGNATSDITSSAVTVNGPCTIHITGTLDGARVQILTSSDDSGGSYLPSGLLTQKSETGKVNVVEYGTYYIKAQLRMSGTSTDVTVVANQ